jgi:LacI family transcriptional regulator
MITIRDVARESGFSPTTVSIVLNNAPLARYIPARTKNRIKRVADRLGYRPNQFARSLRSKRSHTIGVMVFDITDPYCTQILKGIEGALYKSAYMPILIDIQNDRERFKRYMEMLLERRVEGLITIANSLYLEADLLAAFEKRSIPTVVIGRELKQDSLSSVVVDNEAGARTAFEHIYALGHRRIAFIKGPRMLVDSNQRWKGICAAAEGVGFEIDSKLVVALKRPPSYEGGYELTEELLKRKRSFTALVAFDDMTAFGAIRALNHAGLQVPSDCSVIGFDDVAAAAFYNPPLTTIRQPMENMGSLSVKVLVEAVTALLNNKGFTPAYHRVAPELVIRESTQALRP